MKGSKFKRIVGLSLLATLSSQVYATGYKVEFQSASVLADSGDAAVVEDASTNWYNSAGLVNLPQQTVMTGFNVYAPVEFHGTSFAPNGFGGTSFFGSGLATSHADAELPSLHFVKPFMGRYAFGFSMVPAWGFMEGYGNNSIVQYNLIRVYTKSIDLAPSIAVRLLDSLSLGVGMDAHYFSLQAKNHSRTQGLTTDNSLSRISTQDWAYGGHIGLLYQFNCNHTRIGLNYRTKIDMHLHGYSSLSMPGVGIFETNQFRTNFPMPPVTTLSFYHDINAEWAIMGTVNYDQWAVVNTTIAKNYMIGPATTATVIVPKRYHNAFDFGLGAHYKINNKFMLRGSIKYEQTPVPDATRDISFPDAEKLGLNIGAHYQHNPMIGFDAMYVHAFTRTVPINITEPITSVTTIGRTSTTVDAFGAQVVLSM